jgi:hypothetical protein
LPHRTFLGNVAGMVACMGSLTIVIPALDEAAIILRRYERSRHCATVARK